MSDHPVSANPVTRARVMVEAEVPPERRGPGWDRHWRELEAYAAAGTDWTVAPAPPPHAKRKRRRAKSAG